MGNWDFMGFMSVKGTRGFSLVELIIFIVVIGLASALIAPVVQTAKLGTGNIDQLKGVQLARARLEMILNDERDNGFDQFIDPCAVPSPPTICNLPSGYNIATPTISTGWQSNNHYKVITVALSGKATITLMSLVSDAS